MSKKEEKQIIKLQRLELANMEVPIKGITDLLMEKMDANIAETYNKKKAHKMVEKDTRLEEEKINEKIHYTEDGNVGFPSSGFLQGMIEVAPYLDGLDKKKVRGSVRIMDELVPIDFKEQTENIAIGKTSGITKAPRKIIRPQFKEWKCMLKIRYNKATISAEQIINLLNWAGFQMGIGGWRPQHGGTYGQYSVETSGGNN